MKAARSATYCAHSADALSAASSSASAVNSRGATKSATAHSSCCPLVPTAVATSGVPRHVSQYVESAAGHGSESVAVSFTRRRVGRVLFAGVAAPRRFTHVTNFPLKREQ